MDALEHWAEQLAGWTIPPGILAAAPASPWGFDVTTFVRRAEDETGRDTPSRRRALEALPDGGSALDVGCGAGAASLALAPTLGLAVGVDEHPGMLAAFAERADTLGVPHEQVQGRWPDVAGDVADADLVLASHIVHNVADLGPFATALTAHAHRRVVVEMTDDHPLGWLRPYWRRLHDIDRPDGPCAEDAAAALQVAGVDPQVERFDGPPFMADGTDEADVVAFLRRRLCLSTERDGELRAAVAEIGLPATRRLATLWWNA